MAHPQRGMFTDSSMSSDQDETSPEEKSIQSFAKSMLQGRLFIGSYQEKRYVVNLKAYRDVISIDKKETELLHDLYVVQKKIRKFTSRWVGITSPDVIGAPAGHCLWVELENQVFGSYWYKVKNVKFKANEITIKLKQLRSVSPHTEPAKLTKTKATPGNAETIDLNDSFDFQGTLDVIKEVCVTKCSYFFSNVATIKNTKGAVIFISVLLMALFTGSIQLIQYLGDFSLKLMRELSFFVKNASPIVIACINMVGRSIWGLYMLIAMMWKDRKDPITVYQPQRQSLTYDNYRNNDYITRRALPAPTYNPIRGGRTSGVIITPLDD